MKKKLLIAILIIVLITMMVPSLFAAERSSNLPSIDKDEMHEEHPGILPTSPFYFIKELGRGVRRILTINPSSKAEYELQVVRQKIAEIRKLKELDLEIRGAMKEKIQEIQNSLEK